MTLEELINLINEVVLNSKTNNFIITDVDVISRDILLKSISYASPIINWEDITEESFNTTELVNIFIDLNSLDYFNILNYALEYLGTSDRVKLETMRDLLKFRGILRNNQKAVQFIVYNIGKLNSNDAKIFNLLLWINSYFWNTIILLSREDLPSYQIPNGSFLDNRENFAKLNLIKYH